MALNCFLNPVVLRTIKSLKSFYNERKQDDKAAELESFLEAYNFRSAEMFGSFLYLCISNSLDKAWRPKNLPMEDELLKINSS